jgi:hypothetical protein
LTEPLHALRTLVELPQAAPPPVEDLRRRVTARSRRRHAVRATLAGVAVVLAGVAVVPLIDRPSEESTQVVAAATGLPEVAQAPADGSTLVLVADQNCAYLRWQGENTTLGGGCATGAADHSVQTFGAPVQVGDQTATILRGGPAMARYSARLADGRTIDGVLGAHGWAVVVTDGRMVGVSGFDAQGLGVPEWIVR